MAAALKDVLKPGPIIPAANDNDSLFPVVRHMVREVLHRPFEREWSVEGLGMLRTYFGAAKRYRLNVWDRRFMVPNVSVVHDHPWHFRSWIIAGRFTNVRYLLGTTHYREGEARYTQHAAPPNFHCQTIKTGEGGGPVTRSYDVFLVAQQPELYRPGDTYRQGAAEIHESHYEDGTVTLNDRTRIGGVEHARVFWPYGTQRVDAKPRNATEEEIWAATRRALVWFKE